MSAPISSKRKRLNIPGIYNIDTTFLLSSFIYFLLVLNWYL